MIWRFSDGTTAKLGGEIEGASLFAQRLRRLLQDEKVGVHFGPRNGGGWLDRSDPALFDAWLRQEMGRPVLAELNLRLIDVPKGIPPLPEFDDSVPDGIPEPPDDAVF